MSNTKIPKDIAAQGRKVGKQFEAEAGSDGRQPAAEEAGGRSGAGG